MNEKPFWKSKKFVYAVAGALSLLILAVLPSLTALEPETVDMLSAVLPGVIAFWLFVLGGHVWNDAYVLAQQAKPMALPDALHDIGAVVQTAMVDALNVIADDNSQPQRVAHSRGTRSSRETITPDAPVEASHG